MKHLVVLSAVALSLLASEADAQTERYTYTYVTPGGATFAASTFVYNNTLSLGTAPLAYTTTVSFQPVATAIHVYGQGSTTVSVPSFPDHTTSGDVTITSPGGAGQGWGFDYNGVASATAGNSFLTYGIVNGRYALTFSGGGTNLVDTGGRFLSFVILDGDWSGAASHTAATYAAGYTLDSNFVYDAGSNRTLFAVSTDNFQGTNPVIGFSLLGSAAAAVPEPDTWAMMIAGFLGVGLVLRRRRVVTKASALI